MKPGRPLPDVLVELKRQQDAKRDYISPAFSISFDEEASTLSLDRGETSFGMTDLFHRQVGAALSIPAKYYDLMRKEKPDLLAENVNSWLGEKDANYMIRTMDGNARAFLSDRYRRIDNLEIASAVLPLFAGQPDIEIMSAEVTDSRLYLKIVNHRLEMACVGDRVQAGVIISNSEVGLGAVSVQPLIYTLACTNGMVISSMGERKTHVGRAAKGLEDSFEIYSDETMEAEDRAFIHNQMAIEKAEAEKQIAIIKAQTDAELKRIEEGEELVLEMPGDTPQEKVEETVEDTPGEEKQ